MNDEPYVRHVTDHVRRPDGTHVIWCWCGWSFEDRSLDYCEIMEGRHITRALSPRFAKPATPEEA